jgi:hypothetical protein
VLTGCNDFPTFFTQPGNNDGKAIQPVSRVWNKFINNTKAYGIKLGAKRW